MAVSASIDIEFVENSFNQCNFIEEILKYGWKIFDNGSKLILQPYDNGMFDWTDVSNFNDNQIIDIFRKKQELKEIIGVSLSWKDTNIGGEFLFHQDLGLSINLSNNRVKYDCGMTKFDWYIEKLLPVINRKLYRVSLLKYTHII